MTFNNTAASLIKHGFAREVDVEEGLDLLAEAQEGNLVQFGENIQRNPNFICNCCGCCCEAMIAARQFGVLNPIHTSNYLPEIDAEQCNGCAKCVNVCPVEAMSLTSANDPRRPKKKRAKLDERLCLGCGVCVRNCDRDGIRLVARPERVITPVDSTHRAVMMAIERGKLQNLIFDNHALASHRAMAILGVILARPCGFGEAEPSQIGQEISVTGNWIPTKQGGRFRKSAESNEMLTEWEDIHTGAKRDAGVLSTEINHPVGEDAVLVHHVFKDPDAVIHYFSTTATQHMGALTKVAKPQLHIVRGVSVPAPVREAMLAKNVPAAFGELLFGYVKEGYRRPEGQTAIVVTAKWTCKPGVSTCLDDLKYWWQRVGTDAYSMEKGLLRFEVYQVVGEDALIIHEVFETSDELKFYLSKGTAEKYKKDIDEIAVPEAYFFRGPVSWTIRTYSKFLHLPATYSSQGSNFTQPGGNMSDGTTV